MALLGGIALPTYSLAIKAFDSSGPNFFAATAKNNTLPDLDGSGGDCCGTWGGMQGTMAEGDVMLVKGPDGSFFVGEFDAELSTQANPVIRKKYG